MAYLATLSMFWVCYAALVASEIHQQVPALMDALNILKGKDSLAVPEIQDLFYYVQPGVDFPIYSDIPATGFACSSVHQAGYYADLKARCQVFRRCDLENVLTSYLCPNMTVFNQITLVCDWWYNVDCGRSMDFYDYSNSRLYQGEDVLLLDTQQDHSQKLLQITYKGREPPLQRVQKELRLAADSYVRPYGSAPVVKRKNAKQQLLRTTSDIRTGFVKYL